MRDLIDRTELLEWMNRFSSRLAKEADISASYLNGYRAAMHDVQYATRVKTAEASDA